MKSLTLVAATALIATTMTAIAAAPATARNFCQNHPCYHHRGPVGAAADAAGATVGTAAGMAGAAVGTAGAIATSPFRDPNNSYAYDPYRDPNNGFACRPGTWFRGPDGRRHPCQ